MTLKGCRTLIEILPLRDLYTIYKYHHRLTVFVNKGRSCVACGREGNLLLVTQQKGGSLHIDLYTDDFILMTVDHIVPKSIARELGWSVEEIEDLLNKQPMCDPCNGRKGCKNITNDELRELIVFGKKQNKNSEIIRQLVYNENIFSRSLEGVI